jgi:prolyl-tRNA editing enzyme YbaK/EbsC (Cys-tRNA(Pro) deacylase)
VSGPGTGPGTLDWQPAPAELVAPPVWDGLAGWEPRDRVLAAPIDASLADTAAFCDAYGVSLDDSANCVIVAGKRGETITYAACLILATTRADVNGFVRRRLEARRASFAPMDDAVSMSGMEYGGIGPIGLPASWAVLVDSRVVERDMVVVGSGLRRSKIALPGSLLARLPNAEVVEGLAS